MCTSGVEDGDVHVKKGEEMYSMCVHLKRSAVMCRVCVLAESCRLGSRDDMHMWFAHIAAVWHGSTFTDEERYRAVIRSLPSEAFASITSLLQNLTQGNKYDTIKAAISAAHGKNTNDIWRIIPKEVNLAKERESLHVFFSNTQN
ncbi:hypothetical protein Pcinc_011913 [Petrolisthes cinctipes]|uniref:DUF7041 domain-containing protein n=1 Tax=Petrolisthes cinctipes TaxID=88211 RepID=A0AAE1G5W1_PETCI|nr:hypothetical protein Pcinc_011913 [Petrolisthes cinctipes]